MKQFTFGQVASWLWKNKSRDCGRRFRRNIRVNRSRGHGIDLDTVCIAHNYSEALSDSFVWSHTPEGLAYWHNVCKWAMKKEAKS